MVDRVLTEFGHIDILVNNAGITNRGTPVAKPRSRSSSGWWHHGVRVSPYEPAGPGQHA